MKSNEILALFALKRVTQRSIARKHGYSKQAVSRLIHYNLGSDKLRSAVAEALGEDKRRLWPDYYLYNAKQRKARSSHNSRI